MTSQLRDLYQEVLLDHHRAPRNFRRLPAANRTAQGYNPLCGDQITLDLEVAADGTIRDVGFQGSGCAISRAAASMMTAQVKGKPEAEAIRLFEQFHRMLTEEDPSADAAVGKLAVFSGVREFPARIKCAILPWHALRAALGGRQETVTTE